MSTSELEPDTRSLSERSESKGRPQPLLPWWAALPTAALGGALTDLAYPDLGWWPFVFVGIAAVLVSLIGRSFWMAVLTGFVYESVFYLVHIQWAGQWIGPEPMVALSLAGGFFFAWGAGLIALAYRWVPGLAPRRPALGRLLLVPVAVAGLWTAREALFSVWPYGGFAWGRIGHSQIDSPLSELYAWIGISGMTFVVVWLVALVIEAVCARGVAIWLRAASPVALAALLAFWPAFQVAETGSMRVGLVQGNGPAGYFDERDAGDLLAAQVAATQPLLDAIAAGDERVDLVLWPEGGSDWDPQVDDYTASVWDYVTEEAHAPLLGQAITERDGLLYNTAILWAGGEALDTYDKRHPVVWGEYVPDREFFRALVPDLVDMVAREYEFGTTDAVMDIPTASGEDIRAAVNICYDIVDDALLRESVVDGGRVILATSNNADFGRTDESAQQLAFARIRAAELGRAVVNVSTVGISAVIGADGRVVESLPWYEPGTIVADVPLHDALTPAAVGGRIIEILLAGLGLVLLVLGFLASRIGRVPPRGVPAFPGEEYRPPINRFGGPA